jgi:N-acetylglutamate synthase-like GNAT family acetyltransferase
MSLVYQIDGKTHIKPFYFHDGMIKISKAHRNDIKKIALLHQKELPKSFMSTLGIIFLETFYTYAQKKGVLLVANDNNNNNNDDKQKKGEKLHSAQEILGFVLLTDNLKKYNQQYKQWLVLYRWWLLPLLFLKILINTTGCFETYNYCKKNRAELISLCVSSKKQGRGIGKKLVLASFKIMKKKCSKVYLSCSTGNEQFFEQIGAVYSNKEIRHNISSLTYYFAL